MVDDSLKGPKPNVGFRQVNETLGLPKRLVRLKPLAVVAHWMSVRVLLYVCASLQTLFSSLFLSLSKFKSETDVDQLNFKNHETETQNTFLLRTHSCVLLTYVHLVIYWRSDTCRANSETLSWLLTALDLSHFKDLYCIM